MRKLVILATFGALACASLVACSGSETISEEEQAMLQQKADYYDIDMIEKKFHEATTKKDIELMVSLWAPNATLTAGPDMTASGIDEIRSFWLHEAPTFDPDKEWVSDHPAYKVEITVNGDRGTLHFECHYVDANSEKLVFATSADLDVQRIDGKWLITNMVGASTTLHV